MHRWPALILLTIPLAVGCGREESIHTYRVPKPEVVYELNHVEGSQPPQAAASRPERTLAAIVLQGTQGWFFKLSGPPESIEKQAQAFDRFVRSLSFERGQPKWTTPEGWREIPGAGMRFASFQIDAGGEKPLDLSVISLPRGEDDPSAYLLANINRWRGQLNLPPIPASKLGEEMEQIELAGATAYVVDLEGTASETGMGRAPFAGGAVGPLPPVARPAPGPTAGALKFQTPVGWQAGGGTSLSKAAFVVTDGDERVTITVTDLDPSAGDVPANVNRWRGQVGLPPQTQPELESELRTLPIAGRQGEYAVLEGPGAAGKPQTILGVIVQHSGRVWFVKLIGDAPLAAREKGRFEEFVKSIKFGAEDGSDGQ